MKNIPHIEMTKMAIAAILPHNVTVDTQTHEIMAKTI
jgi:hypothetical protein